MCVSFGLIFEIEQHQSTSENCSVIFGPRVQANLQVSTQTKQSENFCIFLFFSEQTEWDEHTKKSVKAFMLSSIFAYVKCSIRYALLNNFPLG